ncbi:acetate kinase [Syntrophotalea carbinolica DSM 2380]|uniref:Acetate kinase n=1 Tax=Syntrophotalea carbinolica (strain DSM 2380 / NBRC 103641 / GraBd1) TaxID=338963 RepID=Q3A730_SYNC1|nr:acetate kinase [Syntrophotalea carbinolica]ABA87817.1 acetate kinase [Syntrophotalea carbinolica DSM 2380]
MLILALNCGSSSVKYNLFDWAGKQTLAKGVVERVMIGESFITQSVPGREDYRLEKDCPDHTTAIQLIIRTLTEAPSAVLDNIDAISAVGHRVVHGGEKFTRSVRIDEEVLAAIRSVQHLAPLHNPPNIAGIEAVQNILPQVVNIAIFDTAFHQTMPRHAYIYALPYAWYEQYGVRRYGFHGTSHLYVSKRAAALLGKHARDCNLITMHIGNGVSHCAIRNGISIDTSMGLTPLEGAVMGTRCGDIDPAIPHFMMKMADLSPDEMDRLLNKKSGVLGITGRYTDRRDIIQAAESGDERCQLSLEIECYRLRKYIGAYLAAVGPLDAIVFTAGVGEHSWLIRQMALQHLEHLGIHFDKQRNRDLASGLEAAISSPDSPIKVFVIPTNEELVFIEDVAAILDGSYADHMDFAYSFAHPDYKPR